jgi:hypothetical protein
MVPGPLKLTAQTHSVVPNVAIPRVPTSQGSVLEDEGAPDACSRRL